MSLSTSSASYPIIFNEEKIGAYVLQNRVPNKSLELVSHEFMAGCNKVNPCQICNQDSLKMTYKVCLEWGDTTQCETISAVCIKCLKLIKRMTSKN